MLRNSGFYSTVKTLFSAHPQFVLRLWPLTLSCYTFSFVLPAESIPKHISKDDGSAMHATLQIQHASSLGTWQKKEFWTLPQSNLPVPHALEAKPAEPLDMCQLFHNADRRQLMLDARFQPGQAYFSACWSAAPFCGETPIKIQAFWSRSIAQIGGKEGPGVCTQMAACATNTTKEHGWRRQVCIVWQSLC